MSASQSPSLRDVQRWLKARIRPPGPLGDTQAGAGGAPQESPVVSLNPQGGEPGEARLAVYAEGYLVRIREALAETYEAVHHLVGESAFRALAADYAARHPSHDYNLSRAVGALPAFLARHPLAQRLPFLPDLARLEWAFSLAFHAPHRNPVSPEAFAAHSLEAWAGLRLVFHPSVQLVESAWPIVDLWQARTTPREQIDVTVAGRPQSALVNRPDVGNPSAADTPSVSGPATGDTSSPAMTGPARSAAGIVPPRSLVVRCALVDPDQAAVLRALLAGRALGQVGEALPMPQAGASLITRWCTGWMAQGWIVGCEQAGP